MKKSVERIIKGNAKRLLAVVLMLGILFAAIPLTAMSSRVSADGSDAALLSGTDISESNEITSDTDSEEKDIAGSAADAEIISESDMSAVSESDTVFVSESDAELISESDALFSMYGIALLAADDIASGTSGTCSWVIDADGVLTIYPTDGVSGTIASTGSGTATNYGWNAYRADIKKAVIQKGVSAGTSAGYLFYNMTACTSIDLSGLDTSEATSMAYMFYNCSSLESLDVSGLDTSKAEDMSGMFGVCKSLKSLDVSSFDVSRATSMKQMFYLCSGLTSLTIGELNSSKVSSMYSMFSGCSSLTTLDLSGFDTSSATSMSNMFENCKSLKSIDLSNFDTSNVTNMGYMFYECNSLESIDASSFDTSNVTSMSFMFRYCKNLTSLNISSFDTSNVTKFNSMFFDCNKLTEIDVSGFDTSNAVDVSYMFFGCYELKALDLSNFNMSKAKEMHWIFEDAISLVEYKVGTKWRRVVGGSYGYRHSTPFNEFNVTGGKLYYYPNDDSGYVVRSVTIHDGDTDIPVDLTLYPESYPGFTGDLTATIVFAIPYTVTFSDNNVVVDEQVVWQGENAIDPYADKANCPIVEGKHFTGWDKSLENIQEDTVITAQYSNNTYTVKFNANGGKGTMADQAYVYGTAQNLTANAFTREGYTFLGWDTDSSADTVVYTDKQEVEKLSTTSGTIVNLYAVWQINQYTIDFDSNGGTEVADITQNYNTDVTAPADPTREGYAFAGWDTEIPGKMPAKDMKVTASWTINQYTIDFDSNGGTEVADITQNYNTDVTAPADPTREGYTFAGWDTEIPGKMPAKDMKITAQWTANSYLVAFDANSGEGTMADQEMLYDTPANLNANTFTKKNYEFVGWSTDSTAATSEYTDGQEVVNLSTGDKVTLYAVWSKNAVTVTASAGEGGSVNPTEANVLIGGNIDITITPANERYEIAEVTVQGTAVDLSTLTESGNSKVLSLIGVIEDTEVFVKFSAEPVTGAPSVEFADADRVYKVNEKIEFEAIGFWQTTENHISGDEYYVPESWHHDDPSGDWGGVDDSAYDYSASFKRSKAGTYILKVDFRKYVYDGAAWVDSGIVTIETEYIVKGEVKGESDTPDTGDDNGAGVVIALNLMLISAIGIVLCIQWNRRKSKENA